MATEEGIVIRVESDTLARVKTVQSSACKACSARGSCNAHDGGKEMEVQALNLAKAKVGDRIALQIETASLLKASFLLYVFPIICMIIGAIIGHKLAPNWAWDPSALSAVLGFLFFFVAILFIKSRGDKMARKTEYRPKIVRILNH